MSEMDKPLPDQDLDRVKLSYLIDAQIRANLVENLRVTLEMQESDFLLDFSYQSAYMHCPSFGLLLRTSSHH